MNERVAAFRVGIVVLAAALVTGLLIVLLGEHRTFWQNTYTVYIRFPRAPGITVDSPVRKQGVLIGRVTHLEPRDEGDVVVTARIDGERKLYSSDIPRIVASSLLGDAVVEFVPSDDRDQQRKLVQDETFFGNGIVASDPIQMLTRLEGDVRKAAQSFETAAGNISALSIRLNNALGPDDQLPRLMQRAEFALDQFSRTMASIDELTGDEELRMRLKQGLADLPATLDEMRLTMGRARESLDSFQSVQLKAERNLDNLQRFTEPLGERGPELVTSVNNVLRNLDLMTTEFSDMALRIRQSDGTLAKLLRDDELYEQIQETVSNIHEASRRIRPIMDDVRVFTDKIATDPGQVGLKRALERKPLGVGLKTGMPQLKESWWQPGVE